MRALRITPFAAFIIFFIAPAATGAGTVGYYRQPALIKDGIVFVAEGDLWKVGDKGGNATRLTSNVGEESLPAISPDGKTLAFAGHYDGPTEVYTMPIAGGAPRRRTFDGAAVTFVSWTADGKILIGTDADTTLPQTRLVALDLSKTEVAAVRQPVPLAQAADGVYDEAGKTLFFTRLPFQGSHTKRYKGGTAQNLWKYSVDGAEAAPLTADYPGTSKNPMWWQGRVYFLSDRDGTMNLWSMKPDGGDLKQHSKNAGWDAASASQYGGRIAYQLGADIHLFDIATGQDQVVPISLDSDFDQTREHVVAKPLDYLTAAHLSADGDKVALTARGRVFVTPAKQGRFVEVERKQGVRYREARFLTDKTLSALSDESGEVELWTLPADGVGAGEQRTKDAEVVRFDAEPSPDGKFIAHYDKNLRLFLYDVDKKTNRKIAETTAPDGFADLRWSPDGKWLAYVAAGQNLFRRIMVYNTDNNATTTLTTDRYDSYSPYWSPDGHWLYFLSDRNLKSEVTDPWGSYQPEPFLNKKTKVYLIALTEGLRSPWTPPDEAAHAEKGDKADDVKIDLAGVQARLIEAPIPAGNYTSLTVNDKAIYWLATPAGDKKSSLKGAEITEGDVEVKNLTDDVKSFEMSEDGKKLLIEKTDSLYVIDAAVTAAVDLAKKDLPLTDWALTVNPREEWKQMFAEAWRMERDYFYDRNLHGVDWKEIRKKYEPLADRVASRTELGDLLGQMVSELSALHIFVRGGDVRKGEEVFPPSFLGAVLARDENAGGYRVVHIYQTDGDDPELTAPLSKPNVNVKEGDIIQAINGTPTLSVADVGVLLRRKAGQPVLLSVKPAAGGAVRKAVVSPIDATAAEDLRYHEWEYTRRKTVEDLGKEQIGYVHLRAMGSDDFGDFAREFYPVFTRQGLIIDVRNNEGGNIDSWIIGRLMRKAWFYWSNRVGKAPMWNMQYAFRGHIAVLCNENTASDGEAFTEGVKRLKIGKVIGTRTWGGEIWLNGDDFLVDKGIATAAEFGVYGPEGAWLIENHGVDPDMVVDNPPHTTYLGEDAQLKAAIMYLQKEIKDHPVESPPPPPYPNKAFPVGKAAK
ncbi:MAG TPA: protease [Planctomycetales bacterium]|jgi:tricorn protease|nr:protease [Planctomycetales bacterium]